MKWAVLLFDFFCLHTTTFVLLSMFSLVETISLKICARLITRHAKCSLPVSVRGSKTPLMFFILDAYALKSVKRNSIHGTLNAYFTECYPFSIKQLNVSNRSISPSQVILGFVSFRSFHRISILVNASDAFQLRPVFTWIYLKQPFSQNLGLANSSFKT